MAGSTEWPAIHAHSSVVAQAALNPHNADLPTGIGLRQNPVCAEVSKHELGFALAPLNLTPIKRVSAQPFRC